MTVEFEGFPSLARLSRECVISEKIDGSNACVVIEDDGDGGFEFAAQSRKHIITPEDDNFGFARWAYEHKNELAETLGPGRHYGEWWGSGIQRGYGLPKGEKRFSLFNTVRWRDTDLSGVPGLYMVPELFVGEFTTENVISTKEELRGSGSYASEYRFANVEGVVVYHTAARTAFKSTFDDCDSYEWGGGKTWSKNG